MRIFTSSMEFADFHNNSAGSLLMSSLSKFYIGKNTMSQVIGIINAKAKISLRLIDWFVTNYAKKHNTIINTNFSVYKSYRSQLKSFSKRMFDPFRRRERIIFYYEKDASVRTTIGQLNFFRWIVQNKIIDHIDANFEAIEKDLMTFHQQSAELKDGTKESKKAIKKKLMAPCNTVKDKFVGKYVVTFD